MMGIWIFISCIWRSWNFLKKCTEATLRQDEPFVAIFRSHFTEVNEAFTITGREHQITSHCLNKQINPFESFFWLHLVQLRSLTYVHRQMEKTSFWLCILSAYITDLPECGDMLSAKENTKIFSPCDTCLVSLTNSSSNGTTCKGTSAESNGILKNESRSSSVELQTFVEYSKLHQCYISFHFSVFKDLLKFMQSLHLSQYIRSPSDFQKCSRNVFSITFQIQTSNQMQIHTDPGRKSHMKPLQHLYWNFWIHVRFLNETEEELCFECRIFKRRKCSKTTKIFYLNQKSRGTWGVRL